MAVAIEFLNMIVPVAEIEKKYPGGWEQCRRDTGCDLPGSTNWSDGKLLRLGTMSEMTLQLMGDAWTTMGFKGFSGRRDHKKWKEFCQFGSLTGPISCDWLSFDEKNGAVSWLNKPKTTNPAPVKPLAQFTLADHPEWHLLSGDFSLSSANLADWVRSLPVEPGVYLWTVLEPNLECEPNREWALYVGKAKSLAKRIYNYTQPFQPHSPNDRKIYFAQKALSRRLEQTKYPLYWKPVPTHLLNESECDAIKELSPLLNARSRYSKEHTLKLELAYEQLYEEVLSRQSNRP